MSKKKKWLIGIAVLVIAVVAGLAGVKAFSGQGMRADIVEPFKDLPPGAPFGNVNLNSKPVSKVNSKPDCKAQQAAYNKAFDAYYQKNKTKANRDALNRATDALNRCMKGPAKPTPVR